MAKRAELHMINTRYGELVFIDNEDNRTFVRAEQGFPAFFTVSEAKTVSFGRPLYIIWDHVRRIFASKEPMPVILYIEEEYPVGTELQDIINEQFKEEDIARENESAEVS